MTGDTQPTLASTAKIVFKCSAGTGRMARDAIHRGAGARIEDVFANGVGKGAVLPVAGITGFGKAIAQHVGFIGTMSGMAITAAVCLRMHMERALAALKLICMTIAAHTSRYPLEQPFLTTYMGAVAGNTTRIPLSLQMGMNPLELG